MTDDQRWMRLALRLASRGRGTTHPNPMVGAVVVKEGQILSQGWHRRVGGLHAEVDALLPLGGRAAGATMYVTLEPCCHHGRTPPCTDALLRSGIGRVVVATLDPNPLVNGRGMDILEGAGLAVALGVLGDEARDLNRIHETWVTKRRPHITLKMAATLDGRTATRTGMSQWITGELARAHAHRRRAQAQALLVGVGTILADDPRLTARSGGRRGQQPARIVLDSRLRTPPDARIFDPRGGPVWIITTEAGASSPAAPSLRSQARVVPAGAGERVDLHEALRILHQADIADVVVEGGAEVAGGFLDAGLVDHVQAYLAPRLVGGRDAQGMIGGEGVASLEGALSLEGVRHLRLGRDWLIEGRTQPRQRDS